MEDTRGDDSPGDRKRKTIEEVEDVDGEARCAKESKIVTANSVKSEQVKRGDPYLQALSEVQHAQERAIAVGKERLKEVRSLYYNGEETRQDPQIVDARAQCDTSMAQLDALTIDLASKFTRVPIYKLPEEVMLQVFSNLDLSSLFACEDTCWIWKKILATPLANIDVWADGPLIHGYIAMRDSWVDIARSFRRIHKKSLKPSVFKLLVLGRTKDCKMSDELSQGLHHFPSEELREMKYHGSHSDLWRHIAECPLLKILHWNALCETETPDYSFWFDYPTCKLEKFDFFVNVGVRVDKHFVQMLSEVKRLRVGKALGMDHIRAIFGAAQTTLEEIYIDEIAAGSDWYLGRPEGLSSSFQMDKLRSISFSSKAAESIAITAPNATTVSFDYKRGIDWTLLNSCRMNIKSLRVRLHGYVTREDIGQELFDMPQLEALELDYTRDQRVSKGLVARYHDYSAAAFWEAIHKNDTAKVRNTLPNLKELTILNDPMLEEGIFLKYIEMRTHLGHSSLRKLTIHLADHCSKKVGKLEALKAVIPYVDVKRFQKLAYWNSSSKEWYQKSRLYYYDVYWDELEVSRSTLRVLLIETKKNDERLQQELFNLPQLELLTLDFAFTKTKVKEDVCVAALWTAYMAGTTNNDKVKLQDILPKLKGLVVKNDSMLNEEIIIKVLEERKRLGFKAMDKIHINLASKCSDEVSRVKGLEKTMSGFTCTPHYYWSYYGKRYVLSLEEEEEVESEVEGS